MLLVGEIGRASGDSRIRPERANRRRGLCCGTGLGLPLTKALAEANRAHFSIKSAPNAGTLIEVAFPPTRIAR